MNTAGVILDIYDDQSASVLRSTLAGREIPDYIKTASLMDTEEHSRIPDRLFALVAIDGEDKLRKYAMHDHAHLTTSIIYFLERGHLLPKVAQDTAARNLVAACGWYDEVPPEPLLKRAGLVGKAMLLATGAAEAEGTLKQNKSDMDRFRMAQASGLAPAPAQTTKMAELEQLLGTDYLGEVNKQADLTGTEMMTHQEKGRGKRLADRGVSASLSAAAKTAAAFVDPYVQITGLAAPESVVEAEHSRFALGDKYPIDTYGQVKQAQAYFDEHSTKFSMEDRRQYAQAVARRADELGVKVAGRVVDYAGEGYGPHIHAELLKRANSFGDRPERQVYDNLREKQASVAPEAMVTLLAHADTSLGLDAAYDRAVVGFRDPVAAVYGLSKVAKDRITGQDDALLQEYTTAKRSFAWNQGSDYVNEDMLYSIAQNDKDLDEIYGEGFTAEFRKDPVGVFKSLPDPQKHSIARLASDNSGGNYRSS